MQLETAMAIRTAEEVPSDGASARDWLVDLLPSTAALAAQLPGAVASGDPFAAFLVAAALTQVVDDHLHPDPLLLGRATTYVARTGVPGAALAERAGARAARGLTRRRAAHPGVASVRDWRHALGSLTDGLADVVVARLADLAVPDRPVPVAGDAADLAWAASDARRLADTAPRLPSALLARVPVLPSCFHSFDLGPADAVALAGRLAETLAPAGTTTGSGSSGTGVGAGGAPPARVLGPVLVVGVRTSGSYLGPLVAAALRRSGVAASATTVRPGRALLPSETALFRSAAAEGATVVVVDDPPVSGSSLADAAEGVVAAGVPRGAVVVAFPRFVDTPSDMPRLVRWRTVTLGWEDWAVRAALRTDAVADTLRSFGWDLAAGGTAVELVDERVPTRADGHVRAVYRVHRADGTVALVAVQGTGPGVYGDHAVEVARRLPEFHPTVHGHRDGLVYRAWFDEGTDGSTRADRVASRNPAAVATALGEYAAARRRRLGAERDATAVMAGEWPAWEMAAMEVSKAFAAAWPAAQLALVNPVVRRILAPSGATTPAVSGGAVELSQWFVDGDGSLRSTTFENRAFWHLCGVGYDPVLDIAGAVDARYDVPDPDTALAVYAARTGDVVSPERWLLLRLAQLFAHRRRAPRDAAAIRAAVARELQAYYRRVYLADLGPAPLDGTLCALDVDGVLETEHLGVPSLTASSAAALRALRAHGARPVLATGRSLDEVRERCRAYGLVAGVAEYGACAYLAADDSTPSLLDADQRAAMDEVRATLRDVPHVVLDPRYREAVRATVVTARGRGPLDSATIALVVGATGGRVRAVPGEGQTDFVPAAVDKGTGLRWLVAALGGPTHRVVAADGSERPLALAVGDTRSDLPMLALALHPCVPAHGRRAVEGAREHVRVMDAPYQAGLGQAVDTFVGHAPPTRRALVPGVLHGALHGADVADLGCACCRAPGVEGDRAALLRLLAAAERGRAGLLATAVRGVVRGV